MNIDGKVVIVTGASSGIGLAAAKALTAEGAKVALLARSTEILEQISAELPGSLVVTADMTDFAGVRKAIFQIHKHYGRIDVLINNAGRSYAATIEEIDPVIFDEIFHLNVLGPIIAIQSVLPFMRQQGAGSIVNINSGTAFMVIPAYSVYASSKRALLGFTQTARVELAEDDIIVSEVYPFITATNFGKNRMGSPAGRGPAANYAEGDTPEFVAELIVKAIKEGGDQYFASERMKQMAGK